MIIRNGVQVDVFECLRYRATDMWIIAELLDFRGVDVLVVWAVEIEFKNNT